MKRRNVDTGKPPRRPAKRSNKFTDSVYGSSFIYIKFVVIWLFILLADFILEFRFEYIWPFWLLVQSVYETFKYQGLAYSVFFVCIAITSDTICLLFIPIQWLFFMASTYVWIHYVWHTDKGICIPTVSLWLFIMYIEATMRLRDLKNSQLHIELCQPFAAHCIGHPVVTLGIGFKGYVLYRLKLRKQHQVQKENSFYRELLKQALPREVHHNHTLAVTDKEKLDVSAPSNGIIQSQNRKYHADGNKQKALPYQDATLQIAESPSVSSPSKHSPTGNSASTASSGTSSQKKQGSQYTNNFHMSPVVRNGVDAVNALSFQNSISSDTELRRRNTSTSQVKKSNSNSSDTTAVSPGQAAKGSGKSNSGNNSPKSSKNSSFSRPSSVHSNDSDKQKNTIVVNSNSNTPPKDLPTIAAPLLTNGHVVSEKSEVSKIELISTPSVIERLEATIAKLRAELSIARKSELDLKNQIDLLSGAERAAKSELTHLRKDNESLQQKMHTLVSCKQKDKQNIQSMEKRLRNELDNRESAEKLLHEEKRRHKEEEEYASRVAVAAQINREKETAEVLKKAKKDLEAEIHRLEKNLERKEDECESLKKEAAELQLNDKSAKESETLMSALQAMKDKNLLLEKSLSAETRLKLDLFSALGDVKRQLEIAHGAIYERNAELDVLKARISDMLSILPEQRLRSPTPHYSANFLEKPMVQLSPTQEYQASPFCPMPRTPAPAALVQGHPTMDQQSMLNHLQVHLDPNAAMYTPNTSGV